MTDDLDRQIADLIPDLDDFIDTDRLRARVRALIEEREREARADSSEAIYSEGIRVGRQMARRAALEEACRAVCYRCSQEGDVRHVPVAVKHSEPCDEIRALLADQPEGWDGACGACMVCEPGDCLHDQPPASGTQGEGE
jgi:hypothetical protein